MAFGSPDGGDGETEIREASEGKGAFRYDVRIGGMGGHGKADVVLEVVRIIEYKSVLNADKKEGVKKSKNFVDVISGSSLRRRKNENEGMKRGKDGGEEGVSLNEQNGTKPYLNWEAFPNNGDRRRGREKEKSTVRNGQEREKRI